MSQLPEAQSGSNFDKKFSRRQFLQGAGLLGAAILATNYVPALGSVGASEVAPVSPLAPPETEPHLKGWGDLPVVEGEPEPVGEQDLRNVYVAKQSVNFRNENSARGGETTVLETLPVGAVLEGIFGREDLADLDAASPLLWNEMNLVYNGAVLEDEKTGYLAQGYFEQATDVPDVLKQRYTTAVEILDSDTTLAASGLTNVFDKFGGTEDFSSQAARAWNIEVSKESTFEEQTTESPLRAWQFAVSIAAAGTSTENSSELVNVGEIAGEKTPINLYRHVNGNTIDVIGRAVNPGMQDGNDVFIITRYENDPEEGLTVKNVGFASPEGFAQAYQNEVDIAASLTAMTGEGVEELVLSINDLDQTDVFLPGMNEFVPKLSFGDNSDVNYERIEHRGNAQYRARISESIEKEDGTIEEVIVNEAVYIPYEEGGDWIKMPERQRFNQVIDHYASVMGVTGTADDIASRLQYRIKKIGENRHLVEMFDPETGIPLLNTQTEDGAEQIFKTGMRDVVEVSEKKFGFFIDPSKREEANGTAFIHEEGNAISPGAFAHGYLTLSQTDLVNADRRKLPDGYISYGENAGMHITAGNYLAYDEEFGQWLKDGMVDGSITKEQALQHHGKRITETIKAFPDVDEWYFNELLGIWGESELFKWKIVGEDWKGMDDSGYALLSDLFTTAQNAAAEVEAETGKRPRIGLNDFTNLVRQDYSTDNSVTGPKTDLMQKAVRHLAQKGLIDVAALQFGFGNPGAPSPVQINQAIDGFPVPVVISELRTQFFTPEEQYSVVKTLLDNPNVESITHWGVNEPGTLFENNKPNSRYYMTHKAFADYVFGLT